jgi:hypothetical protein
LCSTCNNYVDVDSFSGNNGIFGGGARDYGLSFDSKSCIENVANGTPRCLQYQPDGKLCGNCQDNHILTEDW